MSGEWTDLLISWLRAVPRLDSYNKWSYSYRVRYRVRISDLSIAYPDPLLFDLGVFVAGLR